MFTLITLACFTTLIVAPIATAATWYNWPRLMRRRAMTDHVARAETELSLMQKSLSIEAQQTSIMRQRAEIDMLQLKVVRKDEAVFDLTQRMLHQNVSTGLVSGQAMLQAPGESVVSLPDMMMQLAKCDNILIVARRGAGKSNLIRRIVDMRQNVTILDPHASPQQWGGHKVIGAGLEHEQIREYLFGEVEVKRHQCYKLLEQGMTHFDEETFAFDEMTEITSEVDVARPVQRLLNCRKINKKVVMGGHSMNAADLGLNGKFNLLKNFDAVVKIDFNKATDERRYWLTLHPTGHHDEFTECANPGLYQPIVSEAVPMAVSTQKNLSQGQSQDNLVSQSPVTADSILLKVELPIKDQIYYHLRKWVQAGNSIDSIGRNTIKAELNLSMNNNELAEMVRQAKERVMKEQQ